MKNVKGDSRLKWLRYMNKIRESTIHRILKALSPKRNSNNRVIPRGITPKAVEYITNYINHHIELIVDSCEQSLKELNDNPNSYYQQHRYDIRVVKKAIERISGRS